MSLKTIRGAITALTTPFRDGALDEAAFVALIERQIAAGVHGLVPVGTTGETATLSHEEHRRVVELCVAATAGRVPVIAGAGSNATAEAIDLVRHAKDCGADAALVVTPYYNRPSQEGLFRHYAAIAEAVDEPLIVYNVPSRTGVDISDATLARLARLPQIVGVKDATGDMSRPTIQRKACGPEWILLSGDDPSALGYMAHGGAGCISVTANVAPEACASLFEACFKADFAAARAIEAKLIGLH
ncbi:MAG: 4-hydroxy-tetrahydrodipicolinate synthase, partial [Candidatus Dormibacteria bacterium]